MDPYHRGASPEKVRRFRYPASFECSSGIVGAGGCIPGQRFEGVRNPKANPGSSLVPCSGLITPHLFCLHISECTSTPVENEIEPRSKFGQERWQIEKQLIHTCAQSQTVRQDVNASKLLSTRSDAREYKALSLLFDTCKSLSVHTVPLYPRFLLSVDSFVCWGVYRPSVRPSVHSSRLSQPARQRARDGARQRV